jgi:hypothetical protein
MNRPLLVVHHSTFYYEPRTGARGESSGRAICALDRLTSGEHRKVRLDILQNDPFGGGEDRYSYIDHCCITWRYP